MKEELLKLVKEKVNLRIQETRKAIQAAQSAANEETKSSAGDKYETGRAMAQNDREMYSRQLLEAEKEMAVLESIRPEIAPGLANVGSLVETSLGTPFLAVSAGIIDLNGRKVMVLSPESPLGEIILGQEKGSAVRFRDKQVHVLEIK